MQQVRLKVRRWRACPGEHEVRGGLHEQTARRDLRGVCGHARCGRRCGVCQRDRQREAPVTVRIIEIDRDGRSVNDGGGAAQVAGGLGQYFANQRDVLSLPGGTYVLAANIETLGSGGQQVSQTLAAVTRTIRRNTTITFNARKGKLVTAALDVPGAVEQDRTGTVCAQLEDNYWAPVMWADRSTATGSAA